MQCLNPIIADIHYSRLDGKASLSNFRNFKLECEKNGDAMMLDILKNGRVSAAFRYGVKYLKKDCDVVLLPCRKCVNCHLNRSREWAIRNSLESRLHEHKLFITLTYADDKLALPSRRFQVTTKKGKDIDIPKLNLVDVQKFLKRLRKAYSDYKLRYYLAGEYGGHTLRPHYHILLYGLPLEVIENIEEIYETKHGTFYQSKMISSTDNSLERLWGLGFVNITTFSDYTSMYTSRYCTKKQVSNSSLNYCSAYKELTKEFNTMSRRPGIANDYIIKNFEDIYKHDEFLFHIDDKTLKLKPLKFFDRKFDLENPDYFKFIKDNRKLNFSCYEYFSNLENNYGIAEYLNNLEEVSLNKLSQRRN